MLLWLGGYIFNYLTIFLCLVVTFTTVGVPSVVMGSFHFRSTAAPGLRNHTIEQLADEVMQTKQDALMAT